MSFLKIVKNQNFIYETYIKLKNKENSIIFACQNSLLLNYYDCNLKIRTNSAGKVSQDDKVLLISLGHLFSQELVKFFGTKLPGGLFEIEEVTDSVIIDNSLAFVDINLDETAEENTNYYARFYGSHATINSVNKYILDKTILTQINKVTGYPVMSSQLKIDDLYKISLSDNIRTLQNRLQFLKCSYTVEDNVLDFYFTETIVCYFCSLVIRNTDQKSLTFNGILGKVFAELFLNYLYKNAKIFAKIKSVDVQYVKEKEFLEFSLESSTNQFEFFADAKNKLFLIKLLNKMNFSPAVHNSRNDNGKPVLNHLNLPFSVELGVTYLNQSEYKNLTEGDIIVFDKTCLSTETMSVDKCVINLNGLNLVASLHNDSCQVTHFTKDW